MRWKCTVHFLCKTKSNQLELRPWRRKTKWMVPVKEREGWPANGIDGLLTLRRCRRSWRRGEKRPAVAAAMSPVHGAAARAA